MDAVLEGYDLYDIAIDDQMAINICDEVVQGMKQLAYNCKCPSWGLPTGLEAQYGKMVEQAVGLSANLIKTRIDRKRLTPKKTEGATTIYNVQGDNARWNINTNDNSVNVVTKSTDDFFATMRERISSGIPVGEEQRLILHKLEALQESYGHPSFAQRYTDLIAAAANHVVLLTPFIPALTEMVHKVLG